MASKSSHPLLTGGMFCGAGLVDSSFIWWVTTKWTTTTWQDAIWRSHGTIHWVPMAMVMS